MARNHLVLLLFARLFGNCICYGKTLGGLGHVFSHLWCVWFFQNQGSLTQIRSNREKVFKFSFFQVPLFVSEIGLRLGIQVSRFHFCFFWPMRFKGGDNVLGGGRSWYTGVLKPGPWPLVRRLRSALPALRILLLLSFCFFLCFPLFLSLLLLCCCSCGCEMLFFLFSYLGARHWNHSLTELSSHKAIPSPPNLTEQWIPFPGLITEAQVQRESAGAFVHKPRDICFVCYSCSLASQGSHTQFHGHLHGPRGPFPASNWRCEFSPVDEPKALPTAFGMLEWRTVIPGPFPFLTWRY